jgi:hypothetical protein
MHHNLQGYGGAFIGAHPQQGDVESSSKRIRMSTAFLFPDFPKTKCVGWHELGIQSIIGKLSKMKINGMDDAFVQKIGTNSAFSIVAIWCDKWKDEIYEPETDPPVVNLTSSHVSDLQKVFTAESFKILKSTFFQDLLFDDVPGMVRQYQDIGGVLTEYKTHIQNATVFSCWSDYDGRVRLANMFGEILPDDPNVVTVDCMLVDCVRIVSML